MDASVGGYREIEQQRRIASHRLVIGVHQFRQALYMIVLGLMIEPAGTDAGIGFAGTPHVAILHTIVQHLIRCWSSAWHQAPVGFAHIASFSSYPAQVGTVAAIVPDKRMGLQFANQSEGLCPTVIGLAVDATRLVGTAIPSVASIGAIKPHFEDIAILGEQFAQLIAEIGDIFGRTILGMVSVPRREIETELQSLFAAGFCQFTHHVAIAVFPRCVLHRIVGIGRRPHAEAAMMLCREDDALHARLFADAHPLAAVEVRGIEKLQVLIAKAPLLVGVGVERIMDEGVHLHVLPPQLVVRWQRAIGILCRSRQRGQ